MLLQFLVMLQLFTYTNITLAAGHYETVFASNACVDAKDYLNSTIFNAPKNGTLAGVKLQYLNGSVKCSFNSPLTHWGCDDSNPIFLTYFLKFTDYLNMELMYPTINTQNVTLQSQMNNSLCFLNLCPGGNYAYWMSNYDANSTNYSLIAPIYDVSTNDRFTLQYSEAMCCIDSLSDNSGSTCAAIYFIYTTEPATQPTTNPSQEPTTQPTTEPTAEPTTEPSTNPSQEPTFNPTKSPTDTYYFVIVNATYHGTNTTQSHLLQLLSNITYKGLIVNLTINVSCIIDIHQNITHTTNTSVSIQSIIMTCENEISKMLKTYYDSYLEHILFQRIHDHGIATFVHVIVDIINNAEAEVVTPSPTGIIISTMLINVSGNGGESDNNEDKNSNTLFGIHPVFILLAIMLFILFVMSVIAYYKYKRKKLKYGILSTDDNKNLQMGLLAGEASISLKNSKTRSKRKADNTIEGDNAFYTPEFRGMLSTESESMYKVKEDEDIITKGQTTKGDTTKGNDYEEMYDPPDLLNRAGSTATSQGVYSGGIQTSVGKQKSNMYNDAFIVGDNNDDYKQTNHEKEQFIDTIDNGDEEVDTDGFIGDGNDNENDSSNDDCFENLSTIQ